ncbi:MAG: helix-turn-helix transcriptional regulator [Bacteroidales bacterium]|nr:helix-turn-helix transcriptional regulator [Bacteroidales bacterium]
MKRFVIDKNKLDKLETFNEQLDKEYGPKGTPTRDEFEAKSLAWYYAECLKDARKKAGLTQQEVADRIGKKRTYVSLIEQGKTDLQLSTFIMMCIAVGAKFTFNY